MGGRTLRYSIYNEGFLALIGTIIGVFSFFSAVVFSFVFVVTLIKGFKGERLLSFILFLVAGIFAYTSYTLVSFKGDETQRMIGSKAIDELDSSFVTISEGNGNYYNVITKGRNYTFEVSDKGMYVVAIYKDKSKIYEATEKNVDEWLLPDEKAATKKVREVTGNKDAFYVKYENGFNLIESNNKIYKVSVKYMKEQDQYEVISILHNDEYIYKSNTSH